MSVALRRARPLLGTLVEVGIARVAPACDALAAVAAAFAAIARVDAAMSRQRAGSDLARLNAAAAGVCIPVAPDTRAVLALAAQLHRDTQGAFDASGGTAHGDAGFVVDGDAAQRTHARVVLSLDGIAKGYAVDRAIAALRTAGCDAGWANAGGDLRVFGDVTLPVTLRIGGSTRVVDVRDAALATSDFGPVRTRRGAQRVRRGRDDCVGATVLARECVVADALTKVAVRRAGRALPAGYGASVVWRA